MKAYTLMTLVILGWLIQGPTNASEVQENKHSHTKHAPDKDHHEDEHKHEDDEHDQSHHDEGEKEQRHDEGHAHGDKHGHDEAQHTRISAKMAAQLGIRTASAKSQVLRQSIIVYGSLTTGPEQLSHVRARYSGLITSVKAMIGDTIKKGDLLAEVESNESLKIYRILAPISGTIIQRHANTGEITQDQVLFSIANFDSLWAEFRIYPSQQSAIKVGQSAHIDVDKGEFGGTIQHVIPALDKPYQLARVKFNNRTKGLSPGLLVEGHIVVARFKVDLAIEKAAIQTLGEQQGIFVTSGDEYVFTPVQLGRSDDRYAEVLSGMTPGQRYVIENSYLIKADIEKSEAEHKH